MEQQKRLWRELCKSFCSALYKLSNEWHLSVMLKNNNPECKLSGLFVYEQEEPSGYATASLVNCENSSEFCLSVISKTDPFFHESKEMQIITHGLFL